MLSVESVSGEEETTMGLFSFSPRYSVLRSIITCLLPIPGALRYLLFRVVPHWVTQSGLALQRDLSRHATNVQRRPVPPVAASSQHQDGCASAWCTGPRDMQTP